MDKSKNFTTNEQFLLSIIDSLARLAHKEASIFADNAQQIRHLIIDAVDKINKEFLSTIENSVEEIEVEQGHTANLLYFGGSQDTRVNGSLHFQNGL